MKNLQQVKTRNQSCPRQQNIMNFIVYILNSLKRSKSSRHIVIVVVADKLVHLEEGSSFCARALY